MAHKRSSGRRPKQKSAQSRRTKTLAPGHQPALVSDLILAHLARCEAPASMAQILDSLDPAHQSPKKLKEVLTALEQTGKVARSDKGYLLASDSGLVKATLELTSRGFGFATLEGAANKEKDIFIAQAHLGGASHGDTILLRIIGTSRGRREGRVVKILQRGITRLCGIFTAGGKTGYITPDNERLPYTVLVRRANNLGARDTMAVVAEIIDFGSEGHPPEGKIVEVLGDPATVEVQIRMAIEQFKLPRTFAAKVVAASQELTACTACEPGRADLRDIAHVTIDGETAKDFDDAIAVTQTAHGFTLYVSIADVSYYVQPGSVIDDEAYRRGTSVYLPDLVLPMLPERLSNDLCSLVPHQDRPAFTAILEFDHQGHRVRQRYTKSLITSHQRFTYDIVHRVLYLRDQELAKNYQELLPMLDAAGKLAEVLQKRRRERGSIGFNIPELEVRLKEGEIESIARAKRNSAHQLVEEFMLAANEAVAQTLAEASKPVLYRIHELPDPTKVEQFKETASSLGLQLPKAEVDPGWFAEVLEKAQGSPAEYVVNNLLLRTMQQARYSPDNAGHFGLAAQYYLHFTSPIRRYPDLVAHRVLHNFLASGKAAPVEGSILPGQEISLPQAGVYLSKCERVAIDIERNVQARLATLFLRDHVGEEFEAIISGVTSFGLFIELLEILVSGAVPLRDMRDDYYIFDGRAHRLIGERTGTIFQLGNPVRVRLEQADVMAKKLTFSVV